MAHALRYFIDPARLPFHAPLCAHIATSPSMYRLDLGAGCALRIPRSFGCITESHSSPREHWDSVNRAVSSKVICPQLELRRSHSYSHSPDKPLLPHPKRKNRSYKYLHGDATEHSFGLGLGLSVNNIHISSASTDPAISLSPTYDVATYLSALHVREHRIGLSTACRHSSTCPSIPSWPLVHLVSGFWNTLRGSIPPRTSPLWVVLIVASFIHVDGEACN